MNTASETRSSPAASPMSHEECIAKVLLWPIALFVLLRVLSALVPVPWMSKEWSSISRTLVLHGLVLAWCAFALSRRRQSLGALFGRRLRWADFRLIGPLALAEICLSVLWLVGVTALLHTTSELDASGATSAEVPGLALSLTQSAYSLLLGPLVEEIVFRALLFRKWRLRWGLARAAFASSIVFGLMHFDPVGAGFFGLLMTLLYARTRTLWAPLAVHCFHNAFGDALKYFRVLAPDQSAAFFSFLDVWGLAIAPILLGVSVLYLTRFTRSSWPALNGPLPPWASREESKATATGTSAISPRVGSSW